MLSKLEQDMYKILAAFNTLEELGYEYKGGCKWGLKEDSYEDGFEGLVYVEPVLQDHYFYISIDIRKLSEEQLKFLEKYLTFSEMEGDPNFKETSYLTRRYPDYNKGWFTYESLDPKDKEISFNDVFKYKEE